MSIRVVLLPLLVQVALTLALLFWMVFARVRALRCRETKIAVIALGQPNWPVKVQQIGNCFINQFQLPVLFYLLTALTIVTRQANLLFVVLAWLFVGTRLAHVYIHTTTNFVPWRFYAFLGGAIVLLVIWIIYAARILLGAP